MALCSILELMALVFRGLWFSDYLGCWIVGEQRRNSSILGYPEHSLPVVQGAHGAGFRRSGNSLESFGAKAWQITIKVPLSKHGLPHVCMYHGCGTALSLRLLDPPRIWHRNIKEIKVKCRKRAEFQEPSWNK